MSMTQLLRSDLERSVGVKTATQLVWLNWFTGNQSSYLPQQPCYQREKKEEIWLNPVTKTHTPTEQSKKQRDNIKNTTKNFDYTTIADRLRTVSWSNSSHPTGVV